jgi:trimeric autotransporter adhesin
VPLTAALTSPQHNNSISASSRPGSPRSNTHTTASQQPVHDTVELSAVQAQLAAAEQAATDAQAALTARTALYANEIAALKQQLAAATAAATDASAAASAATAAGAVTTVTGAATTVAATSQRRTVQPLSIITNTTAAVAAAPTGSGSSSSEVAQLRAQLAANSDAVAVLEQQLNDSKTHITQLLAAHQVRIDMHINN